MLFWGQKIEKPKQGTRGIYRTVHGKILEGNLSTSPPCGNTFQDFLRLKRSPRSQTGTALLPPIQRPNLSSTAPTKTRPDPCPAPSGDPAPPPPVVSAGPPAARETQTSGRPRLPKTRPTFGVPHTLETPSHLRVAAAVAAAPASGEPYKMATAVRASARPGPSSRASSRTRERALLPSLRLAGAGRPIPWPHTNGCPGLGSQPPRHGGGACRGRRCATEVGPPPARASQSPPWKGSSVRRARDATTAEVKSEPRGSH